MPTLEQLMIGRTAFEIMDTQLQRVQEKGLPTTDYYSGAAGRTILEVNAEVEADAQQLVRRIAQWGTFEANEGDWLDAKVEDEYGLKRNQATFSKHRARLTCDAGFGPYTITPTTIWASTPGNPDEALKFLVATGGVLNDDGTLDVDLVAEHPGKAYNVAPGAITVLRTPLPGVSITNPAMAATNTSLLEVAIDRETDTNYLRRARLEFANRGAGRTDDAYESFARAARAEVTVVLVRSEHPRGQGTVDVIISGDDPLTPAIVADVNAYIQLRAPGHADVLVQAASAVLEPVDVVMKVRTGYKGSAQIAAPANLLALARDIGIAGTSYRDAIIGALMKAPGMKDVDLNAPMADRLLGPNEEIRFQFNPVWVEV